MSEPTWEIDAPSLALSLRWGDSVLHTVHLAPPRSFFLGDATADWRLPDGAVGPGRVPIVLAERGALYLVLLPSMDPDGTIAAPGRAKRSVAELARPGMAEALREVPGAFLVPLVPGMTADLTIGDFAISVALEAKATRADFGRFRSGRWAAAFQVGSAALHVGLLVLAAAQVPPPEDPEDDFLSRDQMFALHAELQHLDEKEEAAIAAGEAPREDVEEVETMPWSLRHPQGNREMVVPFFEPPHRPVLAAGFWGEVLVPLPYGTMFGPPLDLTAPLRAWRRGPIDNRDILDEGTFSAMLEPSYQGLSTFALDVDTSGYARSRRSLRRGEMPAPEAVRPEAFVNHFDYRYPDPAREDAAPFTVHFAAAPSPLAPGHHLIRVGVQGRRDVEGAGEILARDATIQLSWSPEAVSVYRIVGFEPRDEELHRAALGVRPGPIEAGLSVTAIFEVALLRKEISPVTVHLDYLAKTRARWLTRLDFVMKPEAIAPSFDRAPPSFRLAAAAACFADVLRGSPFTAKWSLADVERLVPTPAGADDPARDLVDLIRRARAIDEARRGREHDAVGVSAPRREAQPDVVGTSRAPGYLRRP